MRCCIASLESLEDTLVPALITFYTDSTNQSKRLLLKTLSNHWSDEIVQLETLLHRVIDTAAMSKVHFVHICKIFRVGKPNFWFAIPKGHPP